MSNQRKGFMCALLMCVSLPASSTIVHLSGATVDFYYDNAQPGMAAYGTLTAVGDSIFATPTNFLAQSTNGGVSNFSALGTVQVVLKSGYRFDAIQVAQQGDYQMSGPGASVSVSGNLTVEDTANAATNDSTAMVSADNFSLQDNKLHGWSSIGGFDLSTSTWTNVYSIDLSLDTLLNAVTLNSGESALIQNKLTGGGFVTIETVPVPLPAAFWLMAGGLSMLFGFLRSPRNT